MFSHKIIPTISKPIRLIKNTATATDHIITNIVVDTEFKSGIIQRNLLDHFLVICTLHTYENKLKKTMNILLIRDIMTNIQQTYLSKNCMKQHGITLRI